jgi:hypothetical protein
MYRSQQVQVTAQAPSMYTGDKSYLLKWAMESNSMETLNKSYLLSKII